MRHIGIRAASLFIVTPSRREPTPRPSPNTASGSFAAASESVSRVCPERAPIPGEKDEAYPTEPLRRVASSSAPELTSVQRRESDRLSGRLLLVLDSAPLAASLMARGER